MTNKLKAWLTSIIASAIHDAMKKEEVEITILQHCHDQDIRYHASNGHIVLAVSPTSEGKFNAVFSRPK